MQALGFLLPRSVEMGFILPNSPVTCNHRNVDRAWIVEKGKAVEAGGGEFGSLVLGLSG